MTRAQPESAIDRSQTDWYKDAIIYQLHIKAFQDSNGDGIGDFAGLIQRLDYVQALGATAIWVLPFYPSPLRDDGYDISDYRSINPAYGRMSDFKAFVAEAHKRGLRVITELVINHTSDQHPWFQKARHAKPGSAARDFYVWSDTDEKFPETRIIFTDTEKSNWTWDPVAKAYFWHRFYSHQPDLNFDNPRVLREILKVMHLWLEAGVDGLRLDAIPYLVEREGTNNENLPETHVVLKKIRAELDAHYSDRMLLAEANQWPEDTRPYFGDGDECHMGFHFPLMPRMYMAVAQEDRYPITDIIRQTPAIPENCQWGIFLRNHDELTLEMVTDRERDYLWQTYAEDRRSRINLGIRRRLAPLMQNDRRKIELMNSLLLSMPGTPILYYGDEIGMGDNYYLGDRDGVRTPMQWSSDRNAGFSRADPQQLYLPVILDPIYGYPAVNVESQDRDSSSLLNWMRRIVSVRKQHASFGRGTMTLLYPANRRVIAYVRLFEGETILCVANLSRAAQAVELDLSEWKNSVPIELTGRTAFPPVGDLPYLITLPAYGFFWFLLADEAEAPSWHSPVPEILPEFVTLTLRKPMIGDVASPASLQSLGTDVLPKYLPLQRWSGAKGEAISGAEVIPLRILDDDQNMLAITDVKVGTEDRRYFLPLHALWGEEHLAFGAPSLSRTLGKLRSGPQIGALVDATFDDEFASEIVALMQASAEFETDRGRILFEGTEALRRIDTPERARPIGLEQSNVSLILGDQAVIKFYRRLHAGVQPEIEMAKFLTEEAGFSNTPAYLGSATFIEGETEQALAAVFAFTRNQGDAWSVLTRTLERDLEDHSLPATIALAEDGTDPAFAPQAMMGAVVGQRTAELHRALAIPTGNEAFAARPVEERDVGLWIEEARDDVEQMLAKLEDALTDEQTQELAARVVEQAAELRSLVDLAREHVPAVYVSRIHGDYHLGQLLVAENDVVIIDFEGEPRRDVERRREKGSPLRDVAGMLRSFDYAAAQAFQAFSGLSEEQRRRVATRLEEWQRQTRGAFLDAYRKGMRKVQTYPREEAQAARLLDLFEIQKAAYEVAYELANRPNWAAIPLQGVLDILERRQADQ